MKKLTTGQFLFAALLTFCVYLATVKFGQYIFYSYDSSPAVILAPAGIALAAVLIGGYGMWLPIACAEFIAAISSPGSIILPVGIAATVGQTLQPLISAYVLNRFGFTGTLSKIRDAVLITIAAIFLTLIAPGFTVIAEVLTHTLHTDVWTALGQSWGGGIMSVLIFTPLITTWVYSGKEKLSRGRIIEICIAFLLLIGTDVFIFWTKYAQTQLGGLIGLYLLTATLFWVALRMKPAALSSALFFTAFLALAGTILVHANATTTITKQLLSDEILIEFLAAIFIVSGAVAEERRNAILNLREHVSSLQRSVEIMDTEEKAKDEFIAILAHELRNPLAPIMSTLELLKINNQESALETLIDSAQQQTRTMRRLLDDLLDVARVAQNKFQLKKETIDLVVITKQAIRVAEHFIATRHHSLYATLPNEKILLFADPTRIEQIIVNLLNNAAKYTPPGGRIEIRCSKEGDRAVIRVSDNGNGIASDELERIFLPFQQARAVPLVGTGLGIGLSLTRRLVDMHEGTVHAESAGVGKGSVFTVKLPLPSRIQLTLSNIKMPKTGASVANSRPPLRILIIDDNEAAAEGLSELLRYSKYETRTAHTGEVGLQTVPLFKPDVVLLDLGLPDIDGYEVAGRMQQMQGFHMPILIALSGYGQDGDKQKTKKAGFDHHLTKPVMLKEIEQVLGQLLSRDDDVVSYSSEVFDRA